MRPTVGNITYYCSSCGSKLVLSKEPKIQSYDAATGKPDHWIAEVKCPKKTAWTTFTGQGHKDMYIHHYPAKGNTWHAYGYGDDKVVAYVDKLEQFVEEGKAYVETENSVL